MRLRAAALTLALAVLVATLLLLFGRSGNETTTLRGEWGPLAVVRPSNGVMEALTTGTLRITDECVVVLDMAAGDAVLLVWPADRTTWDAGTGTIRLRSLTGIAVTLRNGAQISLGGGGGIVTEWIAFPAPSCPIEPYWIVGEPAGD